MGPSSDWFCMRQSINGAKSTTTEAPIHLNFANFRTYAVKQFQTTYLQMEFYFQCDQWEPGETENFIRVKEEQKGHHTWTQRFAKFANLYLCSWFGGRLNGPH